MVVELQGYRAVVPGRVYEKDTVLSTKQGELPGMCIVMPRMYREPTEDDVVDYLSKKAGQVSNKKGLLLSRSELEETGLEAMLSKLPNQILYYLERRDDNCISFVRANTTAPAVAPDKAKIFLHARFGALEADIVARQSQADTQINDEWYDAMLSGDETKFGYMWSMSVRYSDLGAVYGDIDVLTRHRVHGSGTLNISVARYCDTNSVKEVVSVLHDALTAHEKLLELRDISDEMLEQMAKIPVAALHAHVRKQVMLHAQRGIMSGGAQRYRT